MGVTDDGNPWRCNGPACGHLPADHEVDGRGGGLGPCWGKSARERHWWTRRACTCAGYVAREPADRG